ncbi:hypothetical protein T4D_15328 [Trichinella pseudospiralis]|uniref:Transmembrane protein n=1 Tax=Trichinella pseudospiralis TaxID=6337 RepID=A0A0V1G249_TRIPS|nr:hypothetical protein T4D_15328 [Trichinella pseudospiralis]
MICIRLLIRTNHLQYFNAMNGFIQKTAFLSMTASLFKDHQWKIEILGDLSCVSLRSMSVVGCVVRVDTKLNYCRVMVLLYEELRFGDDECGNFVSPDEKSQGRQCSMSKCHFVVGSLFACLLACLPACLVGWLLAWLADWIELLLHSTAAAAAAFCSCLRTIDGARFLKKNNFLKRREKAAIGK